MKKCWALLLAMGIMMCQLGYTAPARADEGRYCIIPLQTYDSRVKLRRRPSTNAEILGQYFAGTAMQVFAWEGTWAYVSIGGRTGYMMREFLAPAEGELMTAPIGCALYEEASGQGVKVREKMESSSPAVMILKRGDGVTVLGTVGETWLHIAMEQAGKETIYGFVPSEAITQVDNLGTAVVDAGHADETVNLRAAPSLNGQVLGKLFSGVRLSRLFDDHVVNDGWDRVRVGNMVGYIQEKFVDYSSAGCPSFRPPMTELKERNTPLYADAGRKEPCGTIDIYDPFCVLGVFGGSYLVRMETWLSDSERGYEYGFLAVGDVTARPTASATTTGTLRQDTSLYWRDGDGEELRMIRTLEKGQVVFIFGCADGQGNFVSEYVTPDAAYLEVEISVDDSDWSGYVPAGAVEYDPYLRYPESMTLG